MKRYDNDNTSSPDEGKSINDLGLSNTTTSPSSDKENKTRQALITDVFKSGIYVVFFVLNIQT